MSRSSAVVTRASCWAVMTLIGSGALAAETSRRALPVLPSVSALQSCLFHLEPDPERVAKVSGLRLQRDAAVFELERGDLALAKPVGGRDCVAYFAGRARIRFTPALPVEREQLRLRTGSPVLDQEVVSIVFLFADSTAEELLTALRFGPGRFPYSRPTSYENFRELIVEKSGYVEPDFARPLLEGRRSAYFTAITQSEDGARWRVEIDPGRSEEVSLYRVGDGGLIPTFTWSRFRLGGAASDTLERDESPPLAIRSYQIDMTLSSKWTPYYVVDMGCEVLADSLRYLPLHLQETETAPDSVRTSDGQACVVTWKREPTLHVPNSLFWVDLGRMRRRGERFRLHMRYHGMPMGDIVSIPLQQSHADWYPVVTWENDAFFDITYHFERPLAVVSVGDSVLAEEDDRGWITSRWRTSEPVGLASWHIGQLDIATARPAEIPEVRVVTYGGDDDLVKREIQKAYGMFPSSTLIGPVGNDIAGSYRFFQQSFGTLPVTHLDALQSLDTHGEAYFGMLFLDWRTFQATDQEGEDEVLRAHEVAHQWWGVSVRPKTYRDRWLGEGIAEFSALWYMQAKREDTKLYMRRLVDMRDAIVGAPEVASTWLGTRAYDVRGRQSAYVTAIYKRGAWIMHMLRMYLIDLDELDDARFKAMMLDFAERYRGRRASTHDLARVVERHVGESMEWFFDQWVRGTATPDYRYDWRVVPGKDGRPVLTLRVEQRGVPAGFRMPVPVRIDLEDGQVARTRVWVDQPVVEVSFDALPSRPRNLEFNEFQGVLCTAKRVGQ